MISVCAQTHTGLQCFPSLEDSPFSRALDFQNGRKLKMSHSEMTQKVGAFPEPRAEEGMVVTASEFLGCSSRLMKTVLQQCPCLHICNFIRTIELYDSKNSLYGM